VGVTAFEIVTRSAAGQRAVRRIGDMPIHAPELLDVEVISALRRAAYHGSLDATAADRATSTLRALRVQRWSAVPFVPRIWALRHSVSPYDATYLTLAEHLGCTLLTGDERLVRSDGHAARVEAISDITATPS
jgi:predicted nucleic acid-binding protein